MPEGISSPAFFVSRVRLEVKVLDIQFISLVDSSVVTEFPATDCAKTGTKQPAQIIARLITADLNKFFFISSLSDYFEGI